MVLQHHRQADALAHPGVVLGDARLARHRLGSGSHHQGARSAAGGHLRELDGGARARMRDADDERDRLAERLARDAHHRLSLAIAHAVGFAEHAQHGDAVHTDAQHESEHAAQRSLVEALVVVERRGQDRVDAVEGRDRHDRVVTRGDVRFSRHACIQNRRSVASASTVGLPQQG